MEEKLKNAHIKDSLWVAVKVWRGFPEEIKAFYSEQTAQKQEKVWRKQVNPEYDEIGIFQIKMSEINSR